MFLSKYESYKTLNHALLPSTASFYINHVLTMIKETVNFRTITHKGLHLYSKNLVDKFFSTNEYFLITNLLFLKNNIGAILILRVDEI